MMALATPMHHLRITFLDAIGTPMMTLPTPMHHLRRLSSRPLGLQQEA